MPDVIVDKSHYVRKLAYIKESAKVELRNGSYNAVMCRNMIDLAEICEVLLKSKEIDVKLKKQSKP